MVIDEDSRTIVLEGISGLRGGLTELLRKVGRSGPNGQAYRALENPDVRFSRRLYTCFNADLKKARKVWGGGSETWGSTMKSSFRALWP